MEKKVVCCVYLVDAEYEPNVDRCSDDYQKFLHQKLRFCDLGDDPSFYCASQFGRSVTWGVCRHNVRQSLHPGDEVFYVACDKTDKVCWKYYFVGYGEVGECVSHRDLYSVPELKVYQSYFNMLMRPASKGFEHFELMSTENWHDDWKMRVSAARKKADIDEDEDEEFFGCSIRRSAPKKQKFVEGQVGLTFNFGKNYIIFDESHSFFSTENPAYLCQAKWIATRKAEFTWKDENIHKLFCALGNDDRQFTNDSRQHARFNLEAVHAKKLREMAETQASSV